MNLLTPADLVEIRAAMMDIKDTFHHTRITYKLVVDTLDRFNENRVDAATEITYILDAYVTYVTLENDRYLFTTDGTRSRATAKIEFNNEYLMAQGLWDAANHRPIFDGQKDRLFIDDAEYVISQVAMDGAFDADNILTAIYAEPKNPKS